MIIRRPYVYVFVLYGSKPCSAIIDGDSSFEWQHLTSLVWPQNDEIRLVIDSLDTGAFKPVFAQSCDYPIVPAMTFNSGAKITLWLDIPTQQWWQRLYRWLFPYRAQIELHGNKLYHLPDGMPVDIKFEGENFQSVARPDLRFHIDPPSSPGED
jgi:hypothetical protein